MKHTKKFMAILMVVTLVLSMGMLSAFAAEGTNSITITGEDGHTYEVYQIFTGDLAGNVLSNIVWGDGISAEGQTALGDAAALADTLTDDNIKDFQDSIAEYLTNPTEMENTDGTYTLDNLDAGYYLVKDKDGTQDIENGAYTAYILQVVGAVNVEPKSSVPTVDKSVEGEGNNATDANIGDTVTFTLVATLGDQTDKYDTYKLIFHDTMSESLTFGNDVAITLDGETDVTDDFTVNKDGTALTISCDDVIALGATNGSEIVVTYTATLNSAAVAGSAGNENSVVLEYSNDPTWNGEGDDPTAETPEDSVLVFTYALNVNKVDGEDSGVLPGAEFVLSRVNAEGETEYVLIDDNGVISGWTTTKPETGNLVSDEEGLFKVIGLDAGTYQLEETKAPEGYNLLAAPIDVVIASTLTTDEDSAELNALTIKIDEKAAVPGDVETGIVEATVENNAGTTLPSTGGMGTILFLTIGGLVVAIASVNLITRKRIRNVA